MNSINLIGRLTDDVELKKTPNGISVCSFTVAVQRPHVKDTTDFIPCVAWRNTAEFVSRYFHKGSKIALSGVLTSRKYKDQNGQNRTVYEVVCDHCEFCESKPQNATAPTYGGGGTEYEDLSSDDELPF